ncbi:MAG: plasmid stabilization protein [Deltaproteobacteria bacterium RIFOXYD12_FULL_57_12]|nr:MAG: plasmid stabilization protein [Deltaproteobacteria bacterium RIFOXYD12_FULL_57_12]
MIPVIFDPDARTEFLAAIRYYEDSQPDLGRRFRSAVAATVQRIAESPLRYRVLHAPFRRYLLSKFPFAIIYSIEPDHIRVIAVAHTKRKPGYWLSRTQDTEK